ncbi:MAG: PQQ-binding-like beta-propeller repeat protein [Myxococcota bacterium]
MIKRSIITTLLTVAIFGCSSRSPFDRDTVPNNPDKVKSSVKNIEFPPNKVINSTGSELIIMQSKMPKAAIAVKPEDGKVLWTTDTPDAESKYVVARNSVVYYDKKHGIRGLSLESGKPRWSHKLKNRHKFLGMHASYDGQVGFVSIFKPMDSVLNQVSHLTLLDSADGDEVWTIEAQGRMGRPYLTEDHVLVPYKSQYLIIINKETKEETARIQVKKGEVRFIKGNSDGIFFGDKTGVYALTPQILKQIKSDKKFNFDTGLERFEKRFASDHYNKIMSDYSAFDVRMLHGRFELKNGMPRYRKDLFVFNLFKYFFGFKINDKGKARLKWAVSSDFGTNVIATSCKNNMVFYLTAKGKLVGLEMETGRKLFEAPSLNKELRGASFDFGQFKPKNIQVSQPASLLDSLTKIANDRDTRFAFAKKFAIASLAVVGGKGVSRLLKIITSDKSSPLLKKKAKEDLVSHHDPKGIPLYLALLEKPYDYILKSKPEAVKVMAKVLAKIKSKEAVPVLLRLLKHHQTSKDELLEIAKALLEIGDKRCIRPFREFILAYRADPEFKRDIHALQKMAEGLFKFGGPRERQVLIFLASDSKTLPRLKEYVVRMLKKTRGKSGKQDTDKTHKSTKDESKDNKSKDKSKKESKKESVRK